MAIASDNLSTSASSLVVANPAPATTRGVNVVLGKLVGANLNAIAATTIFTTPAAGFTRCVVEQITVDNFSGTWTTASVSYGSSGTPTDYTATATMAGAAANKAVVVSATAFATYGTGIAFVANVTIPQGVAATADITVWGTYE
jgi:hypothetical protein